MKDRHLLFRYLFGLTVCILFFPLAVSAADSFIHFKRLSVDDGLSQNTVLALTQDHNNKIWVGTIDGLNWYEGSRFVSYYKAPDDTTSLANNHVYSLHTDSKGTVWVGTQVGLSRYNIVGNNFTNYSSPDNQPMQVLAIGEPEEGDRLLLATNIGLVIFDKKTGRMKVQPELAGKTIYSVCRMNDGFLLGTSEGVYFYYVRNGNVIRLLLQLKGETISDMLYDDKTGNCWLASLTNGVYCVDNNFQIKHHYNKQNTPAYFLTNSVRTLSGDDKGRVWIGTMEGLLILEPETETFRICRFSPEDPTTLGHNSIRSILKDNQGGMWIGTFYGGLNYYHPLAPAFGRLQHSAWRNSLSDNTVSCIAEDPDNGNLWIGTNDGGLNYYNRKTGVFSYYRTGTSANALKSDNIKCIWTDKDGSVYIGTHGGGMSRLHHRSGRIETYSFPHSTSLTNSCYSLLDGTDGTLWVGGMSGLYLFDKQTGELSQHPLAKKHKKLENVLIYTLFRDSKGRIWIGTEESLFLYAGGKLEELHLSSSAYLHGLIQAFCVQEDSRHEIWIGSSTGLYCYKEGAPTAWKHYTMKDGLPNDFIYNILEDERGRLWLTTNKGLACFNTEEGTFLNYTKQDGLPHDQFNYFGACKAHDGTFFLGSLGGIAYFKPYELGDNPYSPDAVVTGAVVLNQVITDMKSERVRYYQDEQGRMLGMSFPSDQKLFNIRFAVINYLAGKRNQFVYKLEGFETEWNYSRHVSFARASYSNLPPGEYVFKVKACNNNGKWSEATTEFFVHIIPMWYQTWWAKTLFIFFSVGLLVFVIYFFIARAKMKMQVRIEQIERNKIEEISQEKVRFYMNMSHELRTPLSLILAPLEELLGQSNLKGTPVQQKLDYVYKNGRKLLHIVNQLLDFRKTESQGFRLNFAECNVTEVLKETYNRFTSLARQRELDFVLNVGEQDFYAHVNKEAFTKIVSNLLNNAVKYAETYVHVFLEMNGIGEKRMFYIRTVNDGVIIPNEMKEEIFKPFVRFNEKEDGKVTTGTGIGLALSRSLAELHQGSLMMLEGEEANVFCLSLPVEQDSVIKLTSEYKSVEEENVVERRTELADSRGDKPVVLVADDNPDMLSFIVRQLESNYVVVTANDGVEALKVLDNQEVSLVVSDVVMPRMDGFELCKLIKSKLDYSHIPVILLTAKTNIQSKIEGLELGADAYIEKPFSVGYLQACIANLINSREKLRQAFAQSPFVAANTMALTKADEEFMKKLNEIIQNNLHNPDFSMDDIVDSLNMSRSNFYRKIKGVLDLSPNEYLRLERLKRAAQLLKEGNGRVNEICYMVGFNSPSYFSKCFQKQFGVLPKEFAG